MFSLDKVHCDNTFEALNFKKVCKRLSHNLEAGDLKTKYASVELK